VRVKDKRIATSARSIYRCSAWKLTKSDAHGTIELFGKELINLEVISEVSQIDPTLSVNTGLVSIPGLKVRRARTTIEMKDGQSFSIAGLLQDDFQDGVSRFPFLGNIPVLGALFRSTNYQHQQTELVVLITTHLVDPGVARNLASPADAVVLPSPIRAALVLPVNESLAALRQPGYAQGF